MQLKSALCAINCAACAATATTHPWCVQYHTACCTDMVPYVFARTTAAAAVAVNASTAVVLRTGIRNRWNMPEVARAEGASPNSLP